MASRKKTTKTRRKMKRHKKGKVRKTRLVRDGSTPSFPLSPD